MAVCRRTPPGDTHIGGSMGLKSQTKRHQNNTPICFAHLDKCNGIVLACWRSITLPIYGARKSPVFFSPSCEPASCRLLLPLLQLRRVPPPRQLALLVARGAHEAGRCKISGRIVMRSDVAAATGPCGHGKVEISDLTRRHMATCRCRGPPPICSADSEKIRGAKAARLPPTRSHSRLIERLIA